MYFWYDDGSKSQGALSQLSLLFLMNTTKIVFQKTTGTNQAFGISKNLYGGLSHDVLLAVDDV